MQLGSGKSQIHHKTEKPCIYIDRWKRDEMGGSLETAIAAVQDAEEKLRQDIEHKVQQMAAQKDTTTTAPSALR